MAKIKKIPLTLVNHPDGGFAVQAGEGLLESVTECGVSLEVSGPHIMKLDIYEPNLDFKVGKYHIKSELIYEGFVGKSYYVTNTETGKQIKGVQSIRFDGTTLTLEVVEDWVTSPRDNYLDRTYTIEVQAYARH